MESSLNYGREIDLPEVKQIFKLFFLMPRPFLNNVQAGGALVVEKKGAEAEHLKKIWI